MKAMPGTTQRFVAAAAFGTAFTRSGSLVLLSIDETYAVTLPLPFTTSTSTRPSARSVMPCAESMPLICVCCVAPRDTGIVARSAFFVSNTRTIRSTGEPAASANPKFAR